MNDSNFSECDLVDIYSLQINWLENKINCFFFFPLCVGLWPTPTFFFNMHRLLRELGPRNL